MAFTRNNLIIVKMTTVMKVGSFVRITKPTVKIQQDENDNWRKTAD